jgi:alpha-methylacyl-CoA racemase
VITRRAAQPGQHTDEALADWGFTADELGKLRDAGAIK